MVEAIAELVVAVLSSGGLPQCFSGASVAEKLKSRTVQIVQVADKRLLVRAAAAGNAQLFRALREVVEAGVTCTSRVGKRET